MLTMNGTGQVTKRNRLTFTPARLPAALFGGDYLNMEFFYNDLRMRTYDDDYMGEIIVPYKAEIDALDAEQESLQAEGEDLLRRLKAGEDVENIEAELAENKTKAEAFNEKAFEVRTRMVCARAAHLIERVKMPDGEVPPHYSIPMSFLSLEDEGSLADHQMPVLDVLTNPAFVQEVAESKRNPFTLMRYLTSMS